MGSRGTAIVFALALAACDGEPALDAGREDAGGPCAGATDGTACGEDLVCVAGDCVESVCGDGVVDDRSEDCEDGNTTAFDGCEPLVCRHTCMSDDQCDDGERCNGTEVCSATTHVCVTGSPADPPCDRVPGSITALGGARSGGTIVVYGESFEGLGYGCTGSICATGRIGP